jgi:hypothetical protein
MGDGVARNLNRRTKMKIEMKYVGSSASPVEVEVAVSDVQPTDECHLYIGWPAGIDPDGSPFKTLTGPGTVTFKGNPGGIADGRHILKVFATSNTGSAAVQGHLIATTPAAAAKGGAAAANYSLSGTTLVLPGKVLLPPSPSAVPKPGVVASAIDTMLRPPMPEERGPADVAVEFDVDPDVELYQVEIVYPGTFDPPRHVRFIHRSDADPNGRIRYTFAANTNTTTAGRHTAQVTITPLDGRGVPMPAPGPRRHKLPIYVIDKGGLGVLHANAIKENFDQVVGERLATAVGSIATQLRTTNRNAFKLTRASDPFEGNPGRKAFWDAIKASSSALTFDAYNRFMTQNFCPPSVPLQGNSTMAMPFSQVDTYLRLKAFTELFLLQNAGVIIAPPGGPIGPQAAAAMNPVLLLNQIIATRPYLQVVLQNNQDLGAANLDVICERLRYPVLIELIWSYWHEESMMVQTLRAIRDRFQNRTRGSGRDPLAQLEMDPLRPLNNILWGYVQDEQHRLGVRQRAYEYLHHYGIGLEGKAVGTLRPADSRKRFLQAFHTLLYQCVQFYRQADDTTVVANANNVLWVLKDLHLLLAEGAHNQFGDLPWNARLEMMMEQWILSRPELQDFLRARRMVPYPEGWMGAVDSMKTLQGWSNTSVIHFRDLGVFGEQILLSVREGGIPAGNPPVAGSGGWSVVTDANEAAAFALTWRNEIEGYINAYRAVTGVDLSQDASDPRFLAERDTAPSVHLSRRLASGIR